MGNLRRLVLVLINELLPLIVLVLIAKVLPPLYSILFL